jgi:hypothetical protein
VTYDEWFMKGYDAGWISDAFCGAHDGPPMTESEAEEDDMDLLDRCMPVARLYPPDPGP